MLRYTWNCSCCGRQIDELPIHWSVNAPALYDALSETERSSRATLSTEFCTIDDNVFFIRGQIEIPLIGSSEKFTWGVWASLSAASIKRARNALNWPDRVSEPPFFGWLSSALPLYPNTINLKSYVHLRAQPEIPFVVLEPTSHPLAVEQREGITLARAVQIAEALLPRH
jgi:hypothetical protein